MNMKDPFSQQWAVMLCNMWDTQPSGRAMAVGHSLQYAVSAVTGDRSHQPRLAFHEERELECREVTDQENKSFKNMINKLI